MACRIDSIIEDEIAAGAGRRRTAAGASAASRVTSKAVVIVGCAAAALSPAPVAAQQAAGPVELETIDVQGRPAAVPANAVAAPTTAYRAATGPVQGFTATDSTAATKTGAKLDETPASISVVGRDQIRDTGAQSIAEATRYTAGVFSQTSGFDPRYDLYQIRGFEADTNGYYLDGLQLFSYAYVAFKVEPWSLERLDILRGPASSLYGGAGPGGIIDAVSKRPTVLPYRRVELGVNNFGNAYGAFDLSGPVSEGGPWFYRVAGIGRAGGTQVDHIDDDRGNISAALSYRPDGATDLTFLGQYQRDSTQAAQFLPYAGTVRPAPYGRIPTSLFTGDTAVSRFDREQAFMGYTFEHSFANGLTMRQNLRYSYVDTHEVGPYGVGYTDGDDASTAQLARYNFITTDRGREFTVDNQAEAHLDLGAVHQVFLAGLDFKHFVVNDDDGSGDAAALNVLHPVYGTVTGAPNTRYTLATETLSDVGLYAQDQVKLGRFVALLSARGDFVDVGVNNLLFPSQSTDSMPHALTGRAALLYTTDWNVNPYVAYGTSFDPQIGINTTTQQAYRPENGATKEVGVKYQAPALPVTASLALFDVTRTNVLTADPAGLTSTQTGEERSRGVELQASATLAEGLKAVGAFTAFHIANTRDLNPAVVGKVPYDTPETLSSLFVDYTIPDGALRGFGFGAGERYVGRSYADAVNATKVPDYWLTDAGLHYERDGYRIAVTAQNLLDRTYVSGCYGLDYCFYGDRRRVTASLSYQW